MQTYVSGGMDDMTSWSRLVWDTLTTMMADGTDDCTITDNPMTIVCSQASLNKKAKAGQRGNSDRKAKIVNHSNMFDGTKKLSAGNIEITKTPKGAYVRNKNASQSREQSKARKAKVGGVGDINLYSSQPYSELGYSMSASNDVLAIGAPGYIRASGDHRQGCVFVLYRPLDFLSGDVDVESAASQMLCEEDDAEAYSRFGQSVAVVDFTGDGIDDLVVGASASGTV